MTEIHIATSTTFLIAEINATSYCEEDVPSKPLTSHLKYIWIPWQPLSGVGSQTDSTIVSELGHRTHFQSYLQLLHLELPPAEAIYMERWYSVLLIKQHAYLAL